MTETLEAVGDRPRFDPEHIAYGDAGYSVAPALELEPQTESFPAQSEPDPPVGKQVEQPLEIRSRPPRATRFRKGLIVASAGGALSALATIAWWGLQPAGLKLAVEAPELQPASIPGEPEEFAGLPASYGDDQTGPPVLGPPLPGDLGRPILEHQRAMATEDMATSALSVATEDPAAQAVAAERQRRLAELVQARSAPVLMQVSREAARTRGPRSAGEDGEASATATLQSASVDGSNPNRLRPAASRWQVTAGSVIAASLITGLNSDLPGMVVAQVTEPVFDSAMGRAVLIPQGARLLGRYESKVAFGQRRAMLVWERLVMPDGSSIALDNAPATDAAGYSGLSDAVDFHTGQLLRGIGMSTLLSVGTELTFGDGEADLVRALRESIQTNADRAGQKIVERNLDIAPTITVRPGFPVRVLVHKDLVLPPWRE